MMKFIAKTFFGLEEVLANEISELGGLKVQVLNRAVLFEGDLKMLYKANLELRTALKILVPFHEFKTKHENHFYKKIKEIDWSEYLNLNQTFAIDAVTQSKYLTHSKYLALKAKDAIVDQFRERNDGIRPSINVKAPTLRINVHLRSNNICSLSFDSSGESLHQRGYKNQIGKAPINEVLAAGMILLSGWEADCDFHDAMCGSGTIPIEAAMIAHKMAPNFNRESFAFQKWKNFDRELWDVVLKEAQEKIGNFEYNISGSDKDFLAVKMANHNAINAGLEGKIEFTHKKIESYSPDSEKGVMIINPPYDERLDGGNIEEMYKMIGDKLKKDYAGWSAWIISSNKTALKNVGLRPSRKITLYNGSLECKFQKYEMYSGSKKFKKMENEISS